MSHAFTTKAKRLTRGALESISAVRPRHWDALNLVRSQASMPVPVAPSIKHVHSAIRWLKAAQDVTGNGGVSWGYRARSPIWPAQPIGWMAAYPETTGYIIETMLRHGRLVQDKDAVERAQRMADWEISIQLPDGGTQGGVYGAQPVVSSTFVTGQVLFGFLSMYEHTAEEQYLAAARRGGDFLVSCLDESGRFVRGYSRFCAAGPKAYESRTGWALAWLGNVTGDARYSDAANRVASYAVSCQRPNGWFAENDLNDHDVPLTHTIGYVLEGLWETGILLNRPALHDAVRRTLERIRPLIGEEGFLGGRWTSDWKPAVRWNCLTGSSQIALVYLRANRKFPSKDYVRSARALLSFVSAAQSHEGKKPGLVGGIQGSYPFDGDYGQYAFLNWATKFYTDAMMEWLVLDGTGGR